LHSIKQFLPVKEAPMRSIADRGSEGKSNVWTDMAWMKKICKFCNFGNFGWPLQSRGERLAFPLRKPKTVISLIWNFSSCSCLWIHWKWAKRRQSQNKRLGF
jgi:hypothetical protein